MCIILGYTMTGGWVAEMWFVRLVKTAKISWGSLHLRVNSMPPFRPSICGVAVGMGARVCRQGGLRRTVRSALTWILVNPMSWLAHIRGHLTVLLGQSQSCSLLSLSVPSSLCVFFFALPSLVFTLFRVSRSPSHISR